MRDELAESVLDGDLDRTILDSSDRSGLERHRRHFAAFVSEDRRERQRLWRLCERLANHDARREDR